MADKFTLFYGGPFSQWYPSPFSIDRRTFPTAEHYMMWAKDWIFGRGAQEGLILSADHPSVAKALGRRVPNFDAVVWNNIARSIVFRGNMAKFSQNYDLRIDLLATYGTEIVEASPYDTIWGIGLGADDPRALSRAEWRGTNWLGQVLDEVRHILSPREIVGEAPFYPATTSD